LINESEPKSESVIMTLDGKVALVTGATSGIGFAAAERLAQAGACVVATGRSASGLDKLREMLGRRGEALGCDVSDPTAIAALMKSIGTSRHQVDILVVNAGVSNAPAIGELTPDAYDSLMDVNCRGAVFSFVHALPLLAVGASVVFVGSVAASKGQPGDPLYAGSKGFIRAFARSAGTDPETLARGIRVNVVSPGPIETPLNRAATDDADARAYVEGLIPMHRWGRPEEVAEAILFLASGASRFTTGAEITVDGGMAHG
jgi:NAD(P)-dependent dehydrogenase (short-subunit alcohol dehydrogenase family)